jgi:cell division protein FtsN
VWHIRVASRCLSRALHFTDSMRRLALLAALLLASITSLSSAQSDTTRRTSPNDSLFRRAKRLVAEGSGVVGRALIDSLLRQSAEGTTGYGDALYWRGALAETAADAERDYRRVIVEYPLSLYSDDALLAIAELEQARGDRAGALQHLQRFVREHPVSAARGVAALAAARLAFEQRDSRTACAMITEARASSSASDVELRNQIDYYASRCIAPEPAAPTSVASQPARDTTPAQAPAKRPAATEGPKAAAAPPATLKPPVKPAPVATPPVVTAPSRPAPSPVAARGIYTIQLAAHNTRADADRLVAKLAARGVTARVSGVAKPFRVRLAFFPTRQAALNEVASLKQKGIIGFVTTEEPSAEAKRP